MVKHNKIRIFLDGKWRMMEETTDYYNFLNFYYTKKAQCLIFILGMQDSMEEYFGKVTPNFKKLIKWNTSENIINDYLKKALRLFWYLNVNRPESTKLNDVLSDSQLKQLISKNCIIDEKDNKTLCNIVEMIKNAKGNTSTQSFDSMKHWLNCIEQNGYKHTMITLGLMNDLKEKKSNNITKIKSINKQSNNIFTKDKIKSINKQSNNIITKNKQNEKQIEDDDYDYKGNPECIPGPDGFYVSDPKNGVIFRNFPNVPYQQVGDQIYPMKKVKKCKPKLVGSI